MADFIGETNLLNAEVAAVDGDQATCRFAGDLNMTCNIGHGVSTGEDVHVSIRPERLALHATQREGSWPGTVRQTIFVGTDVQSIVDLGAGEALTIRTQNSGSGRAGLFEPGAEVFVSVEPGAAIVLSD